jgi:hypothetical protein
MLIYSLSIPFFHSTNPSISIPILYPFTSIS